VEQTLHERCPSNQKLVNIAFTFELLWREFWSWRQFSHPLRRLHLCFNIVAVHQRFVTSYDILQKVFGSSRMIKQLVTDCDTVLFVVNLSADTAQILRQQDASAVFRSNSYGTKFNTCPVFGNFRGCQATNHSEHFLSVI
jgi:hypothetical protein